MNTTVIIKYSNGSTREFIASDALEKLINEGEMFSVTTMHSDMGRSVEMEVSKMHVGNPISALGHMMMMKRNAESLEDEAHKPVILEVLTACIQLLSTEITSHQSGMSPVDDEVSHDANLRDCISAMEYAIQDDSPELFLKVWMEGDWTTLKNEWSDFKLPECANIKPDLKLIQ